MQNKVKLTSVGFVVVSFSHDDAQLNFRFLKVLSLQTYLHKKGQETTSSFVVFRCTKGYQWTLNKRTNPDR